MQVTAGKTISNEMRVAALATLPADTERIYTGIPPGQGWATFPRNTLTLGSLFQPIFSVDAQRSVAYEGLLCVRNRLGQSIPAATVFASAASHQEQLFLDWLCRALHLRNFRNLALEDDLLFLNANPEAASEDPHHPQVFARMIEFYGVDPKSVVIEILETGVSDEGRLVDAASLYRSLGCKIAIDDFGVGHSNFDRLWRLRPDFVKIDRSVTVSAVRETQARLVLANMVKLIQQCGAKVIVEGIETRDEALTALEVGADFLQGFFFARPGVTAVPQERCTNMFASLAGNRRPVQAPGLPAPRLEPDTYARALNLAILDLQRGASFAQAAASFLALPQALRICIATTDTDAAAASDGRSRRVLDQIENAAAVAALAASVEGGPFDQLHAVLQQALSAPHQVHISADARRALPVTAQSNAVVTLSCAFELEQRMVVLCGDLIDRRARAARAEPDDPAPRAEANVIRLHL